MRRLFAAILLIAVLAIGGGAIASTAYQAGLSTAVSTTAAGGTVVTAPVVVPAYAYGYGYGFHGFGFGAGIFGFFGTLLFIFIVFGLIRAIAFGGRHRGGPGWGGQGWGPGFDRDARREHFASKFHGTFEDWHRQAHDAAPGSTQSGPGTTSGASDGPTSPPTATPPAG